MSLFVKARSFLRNLLSSHRVDADLDSEVHSHLEMLMEENLRAGMLENEAERRARIELGGIEQVIVAPIPQLTRFHVDRDSYLGAGHWRERSFVHRGRKLAAAAVALCAF